MTATATATVSTTRPAQDVLLTAEQKRFFDVYGFLSLPGLLRDCITEIQDAFEQVWTQKGGGHNGARHDGSARSCLVPFIDQSRRLSALIDDPRIHGAAVSLLGDDFNYMGSDGNYYVGDTGWHRDGGHRQTRFIKIAFYLDPLSAQTGALRVVPGSHRLDDRYAQDAAECATDPGKVGSTGPGIPAVAFETSPGDVVIFNHNTLHSSWGGGTHRRMFTMNLCQRFPADRLTELQDYLATHSRFLIDRNVGPEMARDASAQRQRHLQQVMENDFKLTKATQEARARGVEPSRG